MVEAYNKRLTLSSLPPPWPADRVLPPSEDSEGKSCTVPSIPLQYDRTKEKYLFGVDILRNKDDGGREGAEEPKAIPSKIKGAGQHDAKCQGKERGIGGGAVANAKEDGVGGDGEERREGLDGVHGRDGDASNGHGGEDMTGDLEEGHD